MKCSNCGKEECSSSERHKILVDKTFDSLGYERVSQEVLRKVAKEFYIPPALLRGK